jgi:hypothetical protein
MRKRIVIALLVIFIGVIGVILLPELLSNEPKYQGKRLSSWFKDYYRNGPYHARVVDEWKFDRARKAIRAIGTNAVPFLVAECFDTKPDIPWQTNVMLALSKLPSRFGLPHYVPGAIVSEHAAEALKEIGPPACQLIPMVTNYLNDPVQIQRNKAVWMLGTVSDGGEMVVPFLRAKLAATNSWECVLAQMGLGRLGPAAPPAAPDLIEVARTNSFSTYYAASALARIGHAASNAIPVLTERMTVRTNRREHITLAVALVCVDPSPERGLELLTKEFNENTNSRSAMIEAVISIGTNARPLLPLLYKSLEVDRPSLWYPVLNALLSLGETNSAVTHALFELEHNDWRDHRLRASAFVLKLQPTNSLAVSNLIQGVQDPKWSGAAIASTMGLGATAAPAIPALRAAAADQMNPFRQQARKALSSIEEAVKYERKPND